MTIKEKLQYFSDNGMSVSFIARKMGVEIPIFKGENRKYIDELLLPEEE